MAVKCPKCKKQMMMDVQDPDSSYHHVKRCINCGCSVTPVRIHPDKFVEMESAIRIAAAEEQAQIQDILTAHEQKWEEYLRSQKHGR